MTEEYIKLLRKRIAEQKKKGMTREQTLAEEIWIYFAKQIPFARLMAEIKRKGYQWVFECYRDTRKAQVLNPIALFLWKIKQVKIK